MMFFGTGTVGIILLGVFLVVMFTRSGARFIVPICWALLIWDLITFNVLFFVVQAAILAWMYHGRRQVGPGQPQDGSGTPPITGPGVPNGS